MNKTHPLTDQEILLIATEECELNEYVEDYTLRHERTEWESQLLKFARIIYQKGSDDQLERAVEWIKNDRLNEAELQMYRDDMLYFLQKAMRPQEES